MSGMFILVHLENKVIISRLLGYIFTNVYTIGVVHILYKHPRGSLVSVTLKSVSYYLLDYPKLHDTYNDLMT